MGGGYLLVDAGAGVDEIEAEETLLPACLTGGIIAIAMADLFDVSMDVPLFGRWIVGCLLPVL